MNAAHIHLLFNHFPIIGTIIGLLILVSGYLFRNDTVKKTALGLFIFAALMTIPAYLSGEGTEVIVKGLPGVAKNLISEHEEAAGFAMAMIQVLGLLSLFSLFALARNLKYSKVMLYIVLGFSVATAAAMARTGNLGGEIRHSEIRSGSTSVNIENQNEVDDD